MKASFKNPSSRKSLLIILFNITLPAMLSVACSVSLLSGVPTPNETELAQAVEGTLEAEAARNLQAGATEEVQETVAVPTMSATPIPPTAAEAPEAATLALTQTSAEIPSTTALKPAIQAVTEIDNWKALYWVSLSSGCTSSKTKCWKLNDDYKTTLGRNVAYLTSKEEVLIDEGWSRPALVYWTKRDLKNEAMITLFVDGVAIDVKEIPKGRIPEWKEESVDLSNYKGKSVLVQFSCPVGMKYVNSWFIHDVQIMADYQAK